MIDTISYLIYNKNSFSGTMDYEEEHKFYYLKNIGLLNEFDYHCNIIGHTCSVNQQIFNESLLSFNSFKINIDSLIRGLPIKRNSGPYLESKIKQLTIRKEHGNIVCKIINPGKYSRLDVVNLKGEKIYAIGLPSSINGEVYLPMNKLPKGMYLVMLYEDMAGHEMESVKIFN